MGIWLNAFGGVIVGTLAFMLYPWSIDSLTRDSKPHCYVVFNVSTPPYGAVDTRKRELTKDSCTTVNVDMGKKYVAEYSASSRKKWERHTFVRLEEKEVFSGGPTVFGSIKAGLVSVLVLILGVISWKVLRHVWLRFLGRLTDPMWVRSR